MAATRNKNLQGDYNLEQWSKNKIFETNSFLNAPQGKSIQLHYAGNGLIGGRMHARDLAHNYCDIESYLRGIGSTNLVTQQEPVVAHYKTLNSLNVIHKKPMVIPDNLIVEPEQRPFHLN